MLTSIFFGVGLVGFLFTGPATDFDHVGLGVGTTVKFQTYEDRTIHCHTIEDINECLADTRSDSLARGLILGWSQLHGINAYQEGDKLIPWLLTDSLGPHGIDLIAMSYGNANPKEFLLTFSYIQSRINLDYVVIGAWLQGMRHDAIRESLSPAVTLEDVRSILEESEVGQQMLTDLSSAHTEGADNNVTGYANSGEGGTTATSSAATQAWSEKILMEQLGRTSLFRARTEAEGQIRIAANNLKQNTLLLRNYLLDLEQDNWKWAISSNRYDSNLAAWEAILRVARDNNIEVLMYVPPRPVGDVFRFELDLYERFKTEIAALAASYDATFVNFEDVAGGEDEVWGKTLNGDGTMTKDGTHFTALGHAMLAEELVPAIMNLKSVRQKLQQK